MRTKRIYLCDYITSKHLTEKERKENGAFYTPPEIALEMARKTKWSIGETVIDPSVGGGNLLAAMMDTYPDLQEELLHGVDIDPEAIRQCMALFPYGNFQVGNALTDDLTDEGFWDKPPFSIWENTPVNKPAIQPVKTVDVNRLRAIRESIERIKSKKIITEVA